MSKIFFKYDDRKPFIKKKRSVRHFVEFLFLNEEVKVTRIDYVFCSDEHLLEINKKYLNHSFYTDIITFNLSENQCIEGEIYISSDRVKENALRFKVKMQEEFLRVIFHGALHLCGYNDIIDKEIKEIRTKEDYYLQLFHVKHS